MQVAAHDKANDRQQCADGEGNAPAPDPELVSRQEYLLQEQQHQDGAELSADQCHVLEARVEAAAFLIGHFGEIGGAGAVLAPEAQSLDDGAPMPMLA